MVKKTQFSGDWKSWGGWGKRKAVSRLNLASKQDLEGSGSFKVFIARGLIYLSGKPLNVLD